MKQKLSIVAFVAALLLTGVGTSFSQLSLSISNNSFELPSVNTTHTYIQLTGAGTSTYVTGWTTVSQSGIWSTLNTNHQALGANVDGAQVVEAFCIPSGGYTGQGVVYQQLTNSWVPGATYTMTAYAGSGAGNTAYAGTTFSIDSLNGSTLTQLVSTNISSATGGLVPYTATYKSTGTESGNGYVVVAFHSPAQSTSNRHEWIDNFSITQDPAITSPPVSVVVVPGTSASFSAPATGATTVSYQWQATNSATGGFTNVPNSGAFSSATTSTLHITNAQTAQALAYQVVVSDTAGTITSSVVNLTLTDPFISVQPLSQTNLANSSVSFSVTAQGASTLFYQWQTNNGSTYVNVGNGGSSPTVSGATSTTLILTGVATNWALNYQVVVSDLAGSVTSTPAVLTLISVPSITTQPASVSVNYGATALFNVVAVGPSLAYQWQSGPVGGPFVNVVNGGYISGATSSTLTVSNANSAVALAYQVVVSNSYGSVTSSPAATLSAGQTLIDVDVGQGPVQTGAAVLGTASDVAWNSYTSVGASSLSNLKDSGSNTLTGVGLNVSAGLAYGNTVDTNLDAATTPLMQDFLYNSTSLTTSVTGLTAYKNSPYTLVVYAAGTTYSGAQAALVTVTAGSLGTTPASATVTSSSRKISLGNGVAYQMFTGILTNSTLTFTLTQAGASGVNLNGFQLQITGNDPLITANPLSQTNLVNSTATFSVSAAGSAPITYQWQEGLVGSGGPYTNLSNGPGISGSTSNVLTLASLTPSESLDYVVIVTNNSGSVTSSPATLTVLTIPDITNNPVSQTVLSGGTATYTVGATGVGTLNYQWQATNSALGGFTNIVGATTNTLTLPNVSSNSATFYQVVVGNLNGSVTSVPAGLTVLPSTTLVDVQFDGVINLSTSTGGLGPIQTGAAVLGADGDQWTVETVPYYITTASILSGVPLTNTVGTANGMTLTVGQTNTPGNPVYSGTYNNTTVDPNTTNLMSSLLESFNFYKSPQAFSISIGGLSLYTNKAFTLVIYAADPNAPVTETLTITGGAANGNTAAAVTTSSTSLSLTNSPGGVGVSYNTFVGTLTNGTLSFNITGGGPNGHIGINGFQLLVSPTVPPVITSEPVSQTNVVGSTVQFNVVAAGASALTYQWQTNGVSVGNGGVFSGTTSNVLTLTSINTNDALAYQVVVSSGGYSVTSSPAANLTVLAIPLITTNPVSQTALSGGTATFTVAANGSGLSYQWQATNSAAGGFTNIVGATTNTLTLTSVTTNNASSYQVIVANGNGSVTSAPPAALNILPATELIDVDIGTSAGKQSGAAVLGASGDIWNGVAAGGNFSPVVDTGSNIVAGVAVVPQTGVTSYNYNGTGGAAVDSGTAALMNDFMFSYNPSVPFTVSVTGLSPYINSPFALVVYSAMGANQGATISLAGATGGTSTNTVTTSGATKQLSLGIGVAYQIFTGIVTNGTLAVTLAANNDPNFHGCNGLQLLLSPTIPPIITNEPASQQVSQGQPVTFTIGVLATAPVTYQWQATNSALGGFTNIVGATTNVFSVTANSASVYQVVVANGAGTVTSTPAILSIIPGPGLLGEWLTNSIGGVPNLAELTGTQPQHGGYVVGTSSLTLQAGQAPPNYAGDSVYFDGSEAVAISNTVSTDAGYAQTYDKYLTNAMTVAFWAQYVPQPGAYVSKNGVTAGWQFQQTNGGAPYSPTFSVVGTGSGMTNLAAVAVTNTLNDGNWHHYAGTWDGPSGIRKVYVDGVLATNLSGDTGPANAASAFRLVLGGLDTVGNDAGIVTPFIGALYDVRIYNYALNQAQVTGLYSNITVVPSLSTNANLTSLTLSPAGTLNPAFASSTLSYTATNAYGSTPTVTVVDADLTATNRLIYNNATNLLASGTPSSALSLTLGTPNVVTVQVTAQDGVTVQTYTVNVIEQPSLSPRPKLTNSVSLGKLTLNWGGQYLGYRLLQQTNNLSKGVSTNLTDWGTVAGTASLTATNITILKTNLDEYYRLVYP